MTFNFSTAPWETRSGELVWLKVFSPRPVAPVPVHHVIESSLAGSRGGRGRGDSFVCFAGFLWWSSAPHPAHHNLPPAQCTVGIYNDRKEQRHRSESHTTMDWIQCPNTLPTSNPMVSSVGVVKVAVAGWQSVIYSHQAAVTQIILMQSTTTIAQSSCVLNFE